MAKSISVAPVVASARALLETATKAFNKLANEQAKLNEKRTGSYTGTILAALECGSVDSFKATYNSLKNDINENVGGIARKLGCKLGKADKEGNAKYTVPSGLMSAVSVVSACMERGISLVDDDEEPRTFTDLRKAKSLAEQEEATSKMSPLQSAQQKIRVLANSIADGADALTLEQANECALILENVLKVQTGEKAAA